MGAIFAARAGVANGGRPPSAEAFVDGSSTALLVSALVAFGGALIAATLIRGHRRLEPAELVEAAA
jgi:hypothetical protein